MNQFSTVIFKTSALRQKIIYTAFALFMGMAMQVNAKDPATLNHSLTLLMDVRGKVLEENGVGVPGVSIKVKNGDKATTTDANGNFSLKGLSDDAVLIVSYIGYVTQEIKVSADMVINLIHKLKR